MGYLKLKEGFEKNSKFCGKCERYASIGFTIQPGPHDIMCSIFGVFLKYEEWTLLRCQECLDAEVKT